MRAGLARGAVRERRARTAARYEMPVLVNLFGTVERVAWGMDREPHQLREVGETLAFLRQPEPPGGWREALDMLPLLKTVMAMRPKTVGTAPCQEVVLRGDDIDLGLPADPVLLAGRAGAADHLAAGGHQGPSAKRQGGDRRDVYNLGIYRMQVTAATRPTCAG